MKNKELKTPVLILDTNKDVNYNNDEGDVWITKISDFVTEQLHNQTYFNVNIHDDAKIDLSFPFP